MAALYGATPGAALCASVEETLTIARSPLPSSIARSAARATRNGPRRLTVSWSSQRSTVSSCTGTLRRIAAALLTSTSSRPKAATASSTMRCASASFAWSPAIAMPSPSSRTVSSSGSRRRPDTATR